MALLDTANLPGPLSRRRYSGRSASGQVLTIPELTEDSQLRS